MIESSQVLLIKAAALCVAILSTPAGPEFVILPLIWILKQS